jgi:hypothetical protein
MVLMQIFTNIETEFSGKGKVTRGSIIWKWEDICQPKRHGCLGEINTKDMNIALMAK